MVLEVGNGSDYDDDDDEPFGYEPEYILEVVRRMLERQRPGIDKTAATLYWNLRELIKVLPKVRPELKSKLEEFSQNPESQHEIDFEVGEDHWKFIANKDNRAGDFRLVRGDEEEAMIVIRQERPNTFAYWNKSFAVSSGRKIFRGPNEPAAQKIRAMITKLAKDSLS